MMATMQLAHFDYYSGLESSQKIVTGYVHDFLSNNEENFHWVAMLELWQHFGLASVKKAAVMTSSVKRNLEL